MSVIAKMSIAVTAFADGSKVNMTCVYDSVLGQDENENARFTKATPWGQAEMTVGPQVALPEKSHEHHRPEVYLLFTELKDQPLFSEGFCALQVVCSQLIDTGFQREVQLTGWTYPEDSPVPEEKRISQPGNPAHFKLAMGVDNMAAAVQFVPQKRYWCLMMAADDRSMSDVLGNTFFRPADAVAVDA